MTHVFIFFNKGKKRRTYSILSLIKYRVEHSWDRWFLFLTKCQLWQPLNKTRDEDVIKKNKCFVYHNTYLLCLTHSARISMDARTVRKSPYYSLTYCCYIQIQQCNCELPKQLSAYTQSEWATMITLTTTSCHSFTQQVTSTPQINMLQFLLINILNN